MAAMIKHIDEAIDQKFLVTKTIKGQASLGSVIHIMDAEEMSDGSVKVEYRVTEDSEKFSYRDYTVKFQDLMQFCKWARPDNFIARHYKEFNLKDIQHYVKVNNRSFTSFCLPIIIFAIIAVWIISIVCLKGSTGIIVGLLASLVVFLVVITTFKKQKSQAKLKLYQKVSVNWDVVIK
ncbi:MAG: hypothetical protein ACI4I6_08180 [Hominimerdicola sp.]